MPRTFDESDFVEEKRVFSESDFADNQQPSQMEDAAGFLKGTGKGLVKSINPLNLLNLASKEPRLAETQKMENAFREGTGWGNIEGLGRLITSSIPVLGPLIGNLAEIPGRVLYGETPEKRGEAFGEVLAIPVGAKVYPAAAKATGNLLSKAAPKLYESALKPSTTLSAAKREKVIYTGLNEEIRVSQKGLNKGRAKIEELSTQIGNIIEAMDKQGQTIPRDTVAAVADEVKPRFQTVNPTQDLATIEAAKKEFAKTNPDQIPVAEAQAMKQNTYRKLKEKSYGEQRTAQAEAEKALARGIKEQLEVVWPELKNLNARESALIGFDKALERAVSRIKNHQIFGIGTPLMGGLGYAIGGTEGAAALAAMKFFLDNPYVKSRLAILLNKASKIPPPVEKALSGVGVVAPLAGDELP